MIDTRPGAGTPARLRLTISGDPVAPSTALAGKAVTWLGPMDPQPQFLAGMLGPLPVLEAVVPPVRIDQRPARGATVRRRRQLVLHLAGHGHYRAADVTVAQAPGDVVVLADQEPVEVTHPAGAHVVVLALPDGAAHGLAAPVQRLAGSPGRLVARGVLGLVEEAPGLGAGLRAGLVHHVAGLVDLALADAALAAGAPAARRCQPAALRRQEVLGWLEAHLTVADLTAEKAAASLGLSRRWLHALLEDAGTSFKAYVTRRRLEICRARLEDPALAHQTITAIALASGFDDLSTFYRRFRRHYRTTPKALRTVALGRRPPRLPGRGRIG